MTHFRQHAQGKGKEGRRGGHCEDKGASSGEGPRPPQPAQGWAALLSSQHLAMWTWQLWSQLTKRLKGKPIDY